MTWHTFLAKEPFLPTLLGFVFGGHRSEARWLPRPNHQPTLVAWRVSFDLEHMGGSKNRDTPKWMVYNGKLYIKICMIFWGETPLFLETPNSLAGKHIDQHFDSKFTVALSSRQWNSTAQLPSCETIFLPG